MRYNRTTVMSDAEKARHVIQDYIAEAQLALDKAKVLADKTGVDFNFTLGRKVLTYKATPQASPLTPEKALEILQNSGTLSDSQKDAIIDVLRGARGYTYIGKTVYHPNVSVNNLSYGWM